MDKPTEVQRTMIQNIDKALKREDDLRKVIESTELTIKQGEVFHKSTGNLRKPMWWRNAKISLMIVGVCLTVAVVIVVLIIHPWTKT